MHKPAKRGDGYRQFLYDSAPAESNETEKGNVTLPPSRGEPGLDYLSLKPPLIPPTNFVSKKKDLRLKKSQLTKGNFYFPEAVYNNIKNKSKVVLRPVNLERGVTLKATKFSKL